VPGRCASWEKEYRDLEGTIALRNYSRKTLAAYRLWVGKFQAFVHSRPTDQLGSDEVRDFLTELAVRYGVAAATQNQAFNALLFFYRHGDTPLQVTCCWLTTTSRRFRSCWATATSRPP
jgi:site-specific recombinase XerD